MLGDWLGLRLGPAILEAFCTPPKLNTHRADFKHFLITTKFEWVLEYRHFMWAEIPGSNLPNRAPGLTIYFFSSDRIHRDNVDNFKKILFLPSIEPRIMPCQIVGLPTRTRKQLPLITTSYIISKQFDCNIRAWKKNSMNFPSHQIPGFQNTEIWHIVQKFKVSPCTISPLFFK
jgi:hypothetical protein